MEGNIYGSVIGLFKGDARSSDDGSCHAPTSLNLARKAHPLDNL